MANFYLKFLLILFILRLITSLDNGLAIRPPMGWLQWARFVCEIDCEKYPDECINEELFKEQAVILKKEYFKFGYEYINIDDCWSELKRDNQTKRLVPDKKRFPNGIKNLAKFIHSKGLKIGLYGDIGTKTCQNYPGFQDETDLNKFYFNLDTQTFAEWEIDSLKVDGCYGDVNSYDKLYPELGDFLNQTRRPILYSCSWPAYIENKTVNYTKVAQYCNTWRNYNDIEFSWKSVLEIIDFYVKNQDKFVEIHGIGNWFDPDMIIIGNNGLSYEQMKAQFAIWSIWSAPLLFSNDLRKVPKKEKEILLNKFIIDVDQDVNGLFGIEVYHKKNFQIFLKPVSPVTVNSFELWCFVIVYFNRENLGFGHFYSRRISDILMKYNYKSKFYNPRKALNDLRQADIKFKVYDLYDNFKKIDILKMENNLTLKVDSGGAVRIVKLVPFIDIS